MSFPGSTDVFNAGWWRIETITPPVFAGTGTTVSTSAAIASFSARFQGQPITPLPGQQVNGTGIPAGTTILASPAPTASAFTMSQQATASASGVAITVGAEPLTLVEAKQLAVIQYSNYDNIVAKLITEARELIEGPELGRAVMLQSKRLYFMAFPWTGYYSLAIRGMGLNPWWLPFQQGVIKLPYPTLQSIVSVTYLDTNGNQQTLSPSLYDAPVPATPGRIQPAYGSFWPVARPQIDSVQITFTCGYGALQSDIPNSIQMAIGRQVAGAYRNREADADYKLTPTETFLRSLSGEAYGQYY